MTEVLYEGSIHTHTDASNAIGFYDSISKVPDLVKTAYNLGHTFVALTDHAVTINHIPLIKEVKKLNKWGAEQLKRTDLTEEQIHNFNRAKNFKYILGSEIYITEEGKNATNHVKGDKFYHFLLLAKDRTGWEQLNEIVSLGWERSYFRGVQRMPVYLSDLERIIGEDIGHLMASSACLGSLLREPLTKYYISSNREEVEEAGKWLQSFSDLTHKLFPNSFYAEIQPALYSEQKEYNNLVIKFAREFKFPLIVANDAHYLQVTDRELHSVFLNSQNIGSREPELFYKYTYLMGTQEIVEKLQKHKIAREDIIEAIHNTADFYNNAEQYEFFHSPIIPYIEYEDEDKWEEVIHNFDNFEWWNAMSHSSKNDKFLLYRIIVGLNDKIQRGFLEESELATYAEKINEELMHIVQISQRLETDISTYFTTMESMINAMWNVTIVGAGRGSAGAFFINYVLDITQINPLPYNFPSERFLHRDKASLPDIDIDSGSSSKEAMLDTLRKWAKSHDSELINIAAYAYVKSKSALQIAARGLGFPQEDAIYLSSLITNVRGADYTLRQMYYGDEAKGIEPNKKFIEEVDRFDGLFQTALSLEGLIKNVSAHAAGVFIFNDEYYKHTSLMKTRNGILITQVDLDLGEHDLGLTKYDLLSTDAVDSIQVAMMMLAEDGYIEWQGSLRKTYDKYLRPEVIDFDKPEIWQAINDKNVLDLFQFLSAQVGIQAIEMGKPQNLFELATLNSVMRLQANGDRDLPLVEYKHKLENPNLWKEEALADGLNNEEIELLHELTKGENHMLVSQEAMMKALQHEKVAGFTFMESDKARKSVARFWSTRSNY